MIKQRKMGSGQGSEGGYDTYLKILNKSSRQFARLQRKRAENRPREDFFTFFNSLFTYNNPPDSKS